MNTFGNSVPQPIFNQSPSPCIGPPLPRQCFSCNSNIALPIQKLPPPCQLKVRYLILKTCWLKLSYVIHIKYTFTVPQ